MYKEICLLGKQLEQPIIPNARTAASATPVTFFKTLFIVFSLKIIKIALSFNFSGEKAILKIPFETMPLLLRQYEEHHLLCKTLNRWQETKIHLQCLQEYPFCQGELIL